MNPNGLEVPVQGWLAAFVSIGNPIGESWAFIWFGAIVAVMLLATVVRLARGAGTRDARSSPLATRT